MSPRRTEEPRPVPELSPLQAPRVPRVTETRLGNGLRVVVVRRPTVPMVQLRIWLPSPLRRGDDLARRELLARSMTLGTEHHDEDELGEALQRIGGAVGVHGDVDGLSVGGESLKSGLRELLGLAAEVLTTATFPAPGVEREAGRLAEHVRTSRSQPQVAAAEAWARRRYGDHPYGRRLPDPAQLLALSPRSLRAAHRALSPRDGVLVLVGDLSPARAVAMVEDAFASWTTPASKTRLPDVPAAERLPMALVHRPGAVQANVRFGGDAPAMADPSYPAMEVANAILTGLFTSRLVSNLREDKGYTYGAYSTVRHQRGGSSIAVGTDVATEVAAPALVEVLHELGRMATLPPSEEEVSVARQHIVGTSVLGLTTQAGVADQLNGLLVRGLEPAWFRDHARAVAAVTPDEVLEVSRTLLAPTRLVFAIVGDADVLHDDLAAVTDLTVVDGA